MALSIACLTFMFLFPYGLLAKTIVCDGEFNGPYTENCYHETIDCGNAENCIVHCNSNWGCREATINCTLTDHCTVHCDKESSCIYVNIVCGQHCDIFVMKDNAAKASTIHLPADSNSSITCDGVLSCRLMDIDVAHNASLDLSCKERETCDSLSMSVSSDSNVDLWCENNWACGNMIINASSFDNTSFNITCNATPRAQGYVCNNLDIIGGTNTSIDLRCVEGPGTCKFSDIVVGASSSINVVCTGSNATYPANCYDVKIIGGNGSDINVTCTGSADCDALLIDARDAASLSMGNCTGNTSCEKMTVYCPLPRNGEKMCIFDGGNNLQFWNLYAVNSWKDIEFISYVNPMKCRSTDVVSTMHCGADYSESCVFAGNIAREKWECSDRDDSSECNVEQSNASPTDCPSPAPSKHHLKTQEIVIIVFVHWLWWL